MSRRTERERERRQERAAAIAALAAKQGCTLEVAEARLDVILGAMFGQTDEERADRLVRAGWAD
ncbi:hypothetical protein [Cryobacterium fucosi]|uniref:Antitoxin VbhA domain-containing protein n=1 Tax=Cryobacterium fucosi TaxID=1259157 RepID=A0A4V3IUX3_9MICO|nr:hypothetical protein [Cryobacterium fucosi]TFD74716.1 hypothetical protein E3T48_12380 [Cryobacterium fucosi]